MTYTLKLEGDDTTRPLAQEEFWLLSNKVDLVKTRPELVERSRPAIDASQTERLPSSVEASRSTTSTTDQRKTKEGVTSGRIAPTGMSSSKPGRSSQKGSGNDGCVGLMDAVTFVNKVKVRILLKPMVSLLHIMLRTCPPGSVC